MIMTKIQKIKKILNPWKKYYIFLGYCLWLKKMIFLNIMDWLKKLTKNNYKYLFIVYNLYKNN